MLDCSIPLGYQKPHEAAHGRAMNALDLTVWVQGVFVFYGLYGFNV